MPTRQETNFARPKNSSEFEYMLRDICREIWGDPNTTLRGRSGQKQYGVDVYGQPVDADGKYRGVQCKLRSTNARLTKDEIETEIEDAKRFPHPLDMLIIATDTPRDTDLQDIIHAISEREQKNGGFRVGIWFWDEITERIATYPVLMVKYYSDQYANLTTLPMARALVDIPINLLVHQYTQIDSPSKLGEALQLRGVRLLSSIDLSSAGLIGEFPPDGVLFEYNLDTSAELVKLAGQVVGYLEREHPLFVAMPKRFRAEFYATLQSLSTILRKVTIIDLDEPVNLCAKNIFGRIFDYGYRRRGALSTINLTVRSTPVKSSSALLDVDWKPQLTTRHFPSPSQWQETLQLALDDVAQKILHQGDVTRIQLQPVLPLPAALAWGFALNLRVARLGVWARRLGESDFKRQLWLSDGAPKNIPVPINWIAPVTEGRKSAIVELATGFDIHPAVDEFIHLNNIQFDAWLQIGRSETPNQYQNIDEGTALAYAYVVGCEMREIVQAGITDIHLFLRMPAALAVLIGQRVHACGRIHLYWFENPSYRYALTLY